MTKLRLYRRDEDEDKDEYENGYESEYEDGVQRTMEYYDGYDNGEDDDDGDKWNNVIGKVYEHADKRIISDNDGGDNDSVMVKFNDGNDARNVRRKNDDDVVMRYKDSDGGDGDDDRFVRGGYSEGGNGESNMTSENGKDGDRYMESDGEGAQYYNESNDSERTKGRGGAGRKIGDGRGGEGGGRRLGGGEGGKYESENETKYRHDRRKVDAKIINGVSYQSEYGENREYDQAKYEEAGDREPRGGGDTVENEGKYEYEGEREYKDEYDGYEDEEDETVGSVEYNGGQYNVTPPAAQLLMYNRIPKCASSTMQTILRW